MTRWFVCLYPGPCGIVTVYAHTRKEARELGIKWFRGLGSGERVTVTPDLDQKKGSK